MIYLSVNISQSKLLHENQKSFVLQMKLVCQFFSAMGEQTFAVKGNRFHASRCISSNEFDISSHFTCFT